MTARDGWVSTQRDGRDVPDDVLAALGHQDSIIDEVLSETFRWRTNEQRPLFQR